MFPWLHGTAPCFCTQRLKANSSRRFDGYLGWSCRALGSRPTYPPQRSASALCVRSEIAKNSRDKVFQVWRFKRSRLRSRTPTSTKIKIQRPRHPDRSSVEVESLETHKILQGFRSRDQRTEDQRIRGLTVASPLPKFSGVLEWNGFLPSELNYYTIGWLTEGRRRSRAHGFNSTAHTHFISTWASSAHTLVNSACTHPSMKSQVRTQALSRMLLRITNFTLHCSLKRVVNLEWPLPCLFFTLQWLTQG